MSYILDALRKADSERERGAVPSIHAQPVPLGSDDGGGRRGAPWWAWLVGTAFVLLLITLAWLLLERDVPPDLPALAQTPVAPPSVMPPPPAMLPSSAVPAPSTDTTAASALPAATQAPHRAAANPATAAPTVATPLVRPPAAATPALAPRAERVAARDESPAAVRKSADKPAAPPARERAKLDKPTPRATTSGEANKAAKDSDPAAGAGGPIYQFNDLPEGLRRELPRLPIGGSIHSSKAADRLLIINGQLFHEGDELAPGLMLEQIQLKSAVLRYKGYRYQVTF